MTIYIRASIVAAVAVAALTADVRSQSRALLEIRTLSSRPQFASGGDALIEVRAPAPSPRDSLRSGQPAARSGQGGTPIEQLTLALNGRDVTSYLKNDPATGSYRGVIEGMTVGANTLLAKATSAKARHEAKLTIVNHP